MQHGSISQRLIENKAKKEGIPVDQIKEAIDPFHILLQTNQEKKTK
jgi:hypothetical protein